MHRQAGEVATFLTIASLIVIAVGVLLGSAASRNRAENFSTSSEAATLPGNRFTPHPFVCGGSFGLEQDPTIYRATLTGGGTTYLDYTFVPEETIYYRNGNIQLQYGSTREGLYSEVKLSVNRGGGRLQPIRTFPLNGITGNENLTFTIYYYVITAKGQPNEKRTDYFQTVTAQAGCGTGTPITSPVPSTVTPITPFPSTVTPITPFPSTVTPITPFPSTVTPVSCIFNPVNFVYLRKNGKYTRLGESDSDVFNKSIFNTKNDRSTDSNKFDSDSEFAPLKPNGVDLIKLAQFPYCCGSDNTKNGYDNKLSYLVNANEVASVKLTYNKSKYHIVQNCFANTPFTSSPGTERCYNSNSDTINTLSGNDKLLIACNQKYRYGWVLEEGAEPTPQACRFNPVNYVMVKQPNGTVVPLDSSVDANVTNYGIWHTKNDRTKTGNKFTTGGEFIPCGSGGCDLQTTRPYCCGDNNSATGYNASPKSTYLVGNKVGEGEVAQVTLTYDRNNYRIIQNCFTNGAFNRGYHPSDCVNSNSDTITTLPSGKLEVACGLEYRYGWVLERTTNTTITLAPSPYETPAVCNQCQIEGGTCTVSETLCKANGGRVDLGGKKGCNVVCCKNLPGATPFKCGPTPVKPTNPINTPTQSCPLFNKGGQLEPALQEDCRPQNVKSSMSQDKKSVYVTWDNRAPSRCPVSSAGYTFNVDVVEMGHSSNPGGLIVCQTGQLDQGRNSVLCSLDDSSQTRGVQLKRNRFGEDSQYQNYVSNVYLNLLPYPPLTCYGRAGHGEFGSNNNPTNPPSGPDHTYQFDVHAIKDDGSVEPLFADGDQCFIVASDKGKKRVSRGSHCLQNNAVYENGKIKSLLVEYANTKNEPARLKMFAQANSCDGDVVTEGCNNRVGDSGARNDDPNNPPWYLNKGDSITCVWDSPDKTNQFNCSITPNRTGVGGGGDQTLKAFSGKITLSVPTNTNATFVDIEAFDRTSSNTYDTAGTLNANQIALKSGTQTYSADAFLGTGRTGDIPLVEGKTYTVFVAYGNNGCFGHTVGINVAFPASEVDLVAAIPEDVCGSSSHTTLQKVTFNATLGINPNLLSSVKDAGIYAVEVYDTCPPGTEDKCYDGKGYFKFTDGTILGGAKIKYEYYDDFDGRDSINISKTQSFSKKLLVYGMYDRWNAAGAFTGEATSCGSGKRVTLEGFNTQACLFESSNQSPANMQFYLNSLPSRGGILTRTPLPPSLETLQAADANSDDAINAVDVAVCVAEWGADLRGESSTKRCDVDKNGTVDSRDYTQVANLIGFSLK